MVRQAAADGLGLIQVPWKLSAFVPIAINKDNINKELWVFKRMVNGHHENQSNGMESHVCSTCDPI